MAGEEEGAGSEETESGTNSDGTTSTGDTEIPSWGALSEMVYAEDPLIVDDGVAFECATLCAEFIGVLKAVGEEGEFDGKIGVTDSHPAPLESLNSLDAQLTRLSRDLYDRIGNSDKSFLAALDDMLHLLKEAGKKYQETEDISSSEFDLDSVKSATGTGVTLTPHSGEIFSEKFLLERLQNAELSRSAGLWIEDAGIEDIEDPNYIWFTTLYAVGDHIRTSQIAFLYENMGTMWYRWGDTVRNGAGDFVNNLVGRTAGAWEGTGSQGVVAASVDFSTQLNSLVEAMWRVGDSYRYAALWLASTEEAMPKDPHNYMGTYRDAEGGGTPYPYLDETTLVDEYSITETEESVNYYGTHYNEKILIIDDPTPTYQENLKNTYVAGIVETNKYFPILPEYAGGTPPLGTDLPVDPLPDPDTPAGPEVPAGDPGPYVPGGGGATGPGGGSWTTPGTPSAEEQLRQLESLEDAAAKEQAAREEAAQDLAEQQSQQQMAQQAIQALQQGLGTVQQAVQDAARQSFENAMPPGGLPTAGLPPGLDPSKIAGLPGPGAGGPGGVPSNAGNAPGASRPSIDTTRLFPRAGLPGTSTPLAGLGGQQASGMPAGGSPMGGAPMGGGGAPGGGGRGQGDDKHERAKYLDRADNIDEGLGDAVDMSRPVVGETGNRLPVEQPQQPVVHRQRPVPAPAPEPAPVRRSPSGDRVILPGREDQ
ncbi:hypothetical protein ACPESR_06970 [Nocardia testacea]|uniref:hypothetical protein n=1 Tax=Nocardia testacea TaxID=248551 RepID=UPI003C2EF5AB